MQNWVIMTIYFYEFFEFRYGYGIFPVLIAYINYL